METTNFWRKSYPAEAVRLTPDNIRGVGEEIGASYLEEEPNGLSVDNVLVQYIVLMRSKALVGDWVVKVDGELRFYQHKEFMEKFLTLSEELSTDEKFARVFQLVMGAMYKQDSATYNGESSKGMDLVCVEATQRILAATTV